MVSVTQVAYEVEGWGVGELVVADDRVVWHDLPWPRLQRVGPQGIGGANDPSQTPTHPGLGPRVSRKASGKGRAFVTEVVQLLQAYFAGERVPLEDVPVDLDYETPFLTSCASALRTIPRARWSRTASSLLSPADLARLAPPGASARAAASPSSSRATASSRPAASGRTARTAPGTNVVSSRSRVTNMPTLSDDLREELAGISPTSDCDRLAELSGLFHVAGRRISAAAEASMSTSTSRAPRSPAAPSRCCAPAA
jgi:hypothetical protein